jgi:hypothetical protein
MRRVVPVLLVVCLSCGPFFWEAPPPIGEYPERVATKRWTAIFDEAAPRDPELPALAAVDEVSRAMGHLLPWMEPGERLPAIDRLLELNRSGEYSAVRANWLHELRELSLDPEVAAMSGEYLEWRMRRELPAAPAAAPAVEMSFLEVLDLRRRQVEEAQRARLALLDEGMAAGPEALRPHWRVQRGVHFFRLSGYDEAAAEFESVMADFPGHPRAEAAALMLARCHLEASRQLRRQLVEAREPVAAADARVDECERVLRGFLGGNPAGRFASDAHGWLGAVAWERGLLGAAVRHQLDRLSLQPTREVTRSVLRECDLIFGSLFKRLAEEEGIGPEGLRVEEDFDAVAVAGHPLVARLFVQHALDPAAHGVEPLFAEDDRGGRDRIDYLKRRILRPQRFVREAMKDLGREMAGAPGGGADPVTLVLLSWAATEAGAHQQSWDLLAKVEGEAGDEVLHARAIVLQRLERHAEAVVVFDELERRFSESPLAADVGYRRAVSWFKAGQPARALVAFWQIHREAMASLGFSVRETPPTGLQPLPHIVQWLDTLVQFTPLEDLVALREEYAALDQVGLMLDGPIRLRALAAGDFPLAARHLSRAGHPQLPVVDDFGRRYEMLRALRQDREGWEERISGLEGLYRQVESAQPTDDLPRLHLALAREWMAQRGLVTMPLLGLHGYAASEEEKQDLLRRTNAMDLGFSREVVDDELDRRDEATHALRHALLAAESDDAAVAAAALELANECLFRRAEFSLYQRERAMESGATALSREIYARLKQRFPESPEARRAVFHVFTPPEGSWMPGDYNPSNSHERMLRALWPEDEDASRHEEAVEQIRRLASAAGKPEEEAALDEIVQGIEAARDEVRRLRQFTDPANQQVVLAAVDRLDDLAVAVSLPGITTDDFLNYARARYERLPEAFASLVDFRDRMRWIGDQPADDTIGGWKAFLDAHPGSPKAEAASMRMARRVARLYRTRVAVEAYHFPQAPIPNGYKRVGVTRENDGDGLHFVKTTLQGHQDRFPGGRYQDDLDLLWAGWWIDSGEPGRALPLIQRILETPGQRDLHGVAVLNFAEIAQDLVVAERREQAAAALRGTPGALATLRQLAEGDTFLGRLEPLLPWLESEE